MRRRTRIILEKFKFVLIHSVHFFQIGYLKIFKDAGNTGGFYYMNPFRVFPPFYLKSQSYKYIYIGSDGAVLCRSPTRYAVLMLRLAQVLRISSVSPRPPLRPARLRDPIHRTTPSAPLRFVLGAWVPRFVSRAAACSLRSGLAQEIRLSFQVFRLSTEVTKVSSS